MDTAEESATVEPTPLRVAVWNLNHWQQPLLPTDTRAAAWAHLTDSLGAHVALVQEAVPPAGLPRAQTVYGEMAGHRDWGSAVVALDPTLALDPIRSVRMPWSRRRYLLAGSNPGSVAVAQLSVPGIQPITLVSVYGVLDGSSVASMHRVIADLLPLFDSPQGTRVILGGDLNVSRSTSDPRYLARSEAILAAIRALDLVEAKTLVAEPPEPSRECACDADGACDHLPTWGAAELDHVFVSPSLAAQVTALGLDPAAVGAGLSDHVPLVLDLALSAERTPHRWDEESFAEEMGRRHGPAARVVVERLVNWADRKERELTSSTVVRTRKLTRFPTNGTTAEPELWFPVDLELAPRGSQPTISLKANGEVVVWFGGMRLPPFDTPEGREPLRRALNTIEGVRIHRWQRGYRPRFDISVLEGPEQLAKLVGVLDMLATETQTSEAIA